MKSAPFPLGLFLVDLRQFRADMHAAVKAHESGTLDDLAAALRSHMRRHAWFGDHEMVVTAVVRLATARNYDRAHKLLNAFGDRDCRLWVRAVWGLTRKLFWPTLAVLVGLSIYHMVVS